MPSTPEGVQQYIAMKRNVLRNTARIQNELVRLQELYPVGERHALVFRKIQQILDDPFAADGLPSST